MNFEDSMEELSSIVQKLESGELSLDESFTLYERGVQLAKNGHTILNDYESRVEELKTPNEN